MRPRIGRSSSRDQCNVTTLALVKSTPSRLPWSQSSCSARARARTCAHDLSACRYFTMTLACHVDIDIAMGKLKCVGGQLDASQGLRSFRQLNCTAPQAGKNQGNCRFIYTWLLPTQHCAVLLVTPAGLALLLCLEIHACLLSSPTHPLLTQQRCQKRVICELATKVPNLVRDSDLPG